MNRNDSGPQIVHDQSKPPVKWIGSPTDQTRPQTNVERLQRLLIVLGTIFTGNYGTGHTRE
jgi:hypothetical protein